MNPKFSAVVDSICDEAEQLWKNGIEPDLRQLLHSSPEEIRVQLAQQLVAMDCEYRRNRDGKAPNIEAYAHDLQIDVTILLAAVDTGINAGQHDDTATMIGAIADDRDTSFRSQGTPALKSSESPDQHVRIRGYKILSELGRGGMGVVYKARQLRPGRFVEIKTIHSPQLASREHLLRFQAEAEAAGRLDHRGIVPVYEVGEDNGVHFFSMGFVDGTDLEKKARERILSCREAAETCRDIADALEYAHQQGVVHRDIKPQNILIGPDGKPRITDFGLAKLTNQASDLTGSGQIMGTAAYMPPEQATGNTADAGPTADVYALGATLYRCITGRPPFQAASAMEILRQVVDDEPVSPRRLNREVDADLETICLKCLEKSPDKRFATARELADELSRYLNHEPIRSRPIGPIQRAARWCVRRPYVAASIGLAALLMISVTVGTFYLVWTQGRLRLAEAERENQNLKIAQQQKEVEEKTELAATQEYFAAVRSVSEKMARPKPGWTWDALDQLQQAAALKVQVKDVVELRSMIAQALCSIDLRETSRATRTINSGFVVFRPDDKAIAVGDWAGVPDSTIRMFDLKQEPEGVELNLIADRVCKLGTFGDKLNALFGDVRRSFGSHEDKQWAEGMRTGAFRPDGSHITVGTRNARIVCWDLGTEPPTEVFNVTPPDVPNDAIDFLKYSVDGSRILVSWNWNGGLRVLYALDAKTGEVVDKIETTIKSFDTLADGTIVLSRDEDLICLEHGSFSSTKNLKRPDGAGGAIVSALCEDNSFVVFQDRALLMHSTTGQQGISLEITSRLKGKIRNVGRSTVIAASTVEPEQLTLCDSLSGQRRSTFEFSGEEGVNVTAGRSSMQLIATPQTDVIALAVRAPEIVDGQSEGVDSLSRAQKSLAEYRSPMHAYVKGVSSIDAMDVSMDNSYLVTLEQVSDGPSRWSRVRKIDTKTRQEQQNWFLGTVREHLPPAIAGDIAITGQGDAAKIAVAAGFPGTIASMSDRGFSFPEGIGIDAIEVPLTIADGKLARWKIPPLASAEFPYRLCVTFQTARGLMFSEKIKFDLEANTGKYSELVEDHDVPSEGWFLHWIWGISTSELSEESEVILDVSDSKLLFVTDFDSLTDSKNARNQIYPGSIWLIPERPEPNDRKSSYRGPISGRPDGGLAAIVRKQWFYQWSPELKQAHGQPWQDFLNNQEELMAVVGFHGGTLVGSDSGLVVRLDHNGEKFLLQESEKAPYDRKEAVSAVAATPNGLWGAAGTLGGHLKVYDFTSQKHAPAFVLNAHPSKVSALDWSADGTLLASGDMSGAIRFWKRSESGLTLWFELTVNPNEVSRLRFSPNDEVLYILHKNERGVRRLNLETLRETFMSTGI